MKQSKTFLVLGVFLIFAATFGFDWLLRFFNHLPYPQTSGEFGDQFGVLNSLFSGLAFVILIYTLRQQEEQIRLQREDLQNQKEDLKLQREEMQRQCEEQKRQADEFEKQNQLMEIKTFESFFYNYLNQITELKKDIIKNEIKYHNSIYPLIEGLVESLHCLSYDINNKIIQSNIKWSLNIMKPYGDSLYILFQDILNRKFEKDRKYLYLRIIFTSLNKSDREAIWFYGKFFKYNKIVLELELDNLLFSNVAFNEILVSPIIEKLRKGMDMEINSWLRR